eukprot:PhM_4_TR2060/c0_g1_i5/m.99965
MLSVLQPGDGASHSGIGCAARVLMRRLEHMLYGVAVPVGVNVCDDSVVTGVSHRFRVRAFEAFVEGRCRCWWNQRPIFDGQQQSVQDVDDEASGDSSPDSGNVCVLVHELVGERSACASDEEWMYAMQREAASDADDACEWVSAVTRVAAVDGNCVSALSLYNRHLSSSTFSNDAVVRHIGK